MNRKYFEINYAELNSILELLKSLFSKAELEFRKDKLLKEFTESLERNRISDSYYSISHEIRSIYLFSEMKKNLVISQDSTNTAGVDFEYEDILIECVICTPGVNKNLTSLENCGYQKMGFYDYNEKFRQVSLRVLTSLCSKREKYYEDAEKGVITGEKPFCIFVNLGSLSQEWFAGEFISEAMRFLVGRGHPKILLDSKTGKPKESVLYDYTPIIKNNNDSNVDTDFFKDPTSSSVSAVIITKADLWDTYTNENTVVFINPLAKNKLKIECFKNIPYWKQVKSNEFVLNLNQKR